MVETILAAVAVIVPLILTNNVALSAVKYLADGAAGKYMLRTLLLAFSLVGIVATSALTGNGIDINQVTELVNLIVMTVVTGVASHFSYRVIKDA